MSANAIADHDPAQAVSHGMRRGRTRAHHWWMEADSGTTHGQRTRRSHQEAQDPAARCGTSPGCGGPAPLRHAAWAWPAFQSWTGKLLAVASIAVRISG